MVLRRLFACLGLCLRLAIFCAVASQGQAQQPLDYAAWKRTAERAEETISAARASTTALETMRDQLVEWRQNFQAAQAENANIIRTTQEQLLALGTLPEDGLEAVGITTQRDALNVRLAELVSPVKTAEIAQRRADGLIQGVDDVIRSRQAEELLRLGPSPVIPTNWPVGIRALLFAAEQVKSEFTDAWKNPVQRAELKRDFPGVLFLVAIGLILVSRGRRWSRRLSNKITHNHTDAGYWIAGFVVSLGGLFLPFAGFLSLVLAVYATGLVGVQMDRVLVAFAPAVFLFLLSGWLAIRIFPSWVMQSLPLALKPAERRAGRLYGALLGMITGIIYFLNQASTAFHWTETEHNVLIFPGMVLAGLLLFRMSGLLLAHSRARAEEAGEETYRAKLMRYLSRGLMVISVIAPLLAAIGYFKAAQALIMPALLSLILMGILMTLQRLATEVYVLFSGNRDGVGESLIPVLSGMILLLISVPFFALIWGARVTSMTELWDRILEGVYLGETRISPTAFLTFAIVFAIGYVLTRLLQGTLKNTVLPKTRLDAGGRNAIVSGLGYIGIFLAALAAITSAGLDLSSIAIVAGALSVGIGFGLQNVVSNFVSGIILLIERPISEGDWIEVGGTHGYVRDISVRSTVIETFDRSDVIVPNADLVSGTVTNYTRGNTVGRVIVPVGVAYGSDTRRIEAILQEIAEAHPMVLANPEPYVVFKGFGMSSLDFEIRAILRDVNWVLSVQSDMNHEIARRFVEEGVEIPFAQHDLWIRNPEVLASAREGGAMSAPQQPQNFKDAPNADDADGSAQGDGE